MPYVSATARVKGLAEQFGGQLHGRAHARRASGGGRRGG